MFDRQDLNPFIARIKSHGVITADEENAIRALPFDKVVVEAKKDFVHVDDETSCCNYIASGLVARFGHTHDGTRQIAAFYIQGDVADLSSAWGSRAVSGLTALSDTVLYRIPHTALRALASNHPRLAAAFLRDAAIEFARLMAWVVNIGRHDAQTRIAHIFCEMALRFNAGQTSALAFEFPITQEQLGDATALTNIHISRSLKSLRDEGLVSFKGGEVSIHDWAGLTRRADFDAAYLTSQHRERRTNSI